MSLTIEVVNGQTLENIPEAKVSITGKGTGYTAEALTGTETVGYANAVFNNVLADEYEVTVTKTGFKDATVNVEVVGENAARRVELMPLGDGNGGGGGWQWWLLLLAAGVGYVAYESQKKNSHPR